MNEVEVALDHANRMNQDLQKTVKRLEETINDLHIQISSEQHEKNQMKEHAANFERRWNLAQGQVEEMKTTIEQAEFAKKQAENELIELADRFSEANTQIANLTSQKRQLESNIAAMQADLNEALVELKNSEERAKKTCQIC